VSGHRLGNGWQLDQTQAVSVHDEAGRITEWIGIATGIDDLGRAHEQELFSSASFEDFVAKFDRPA
jgi:hypothetical protein